ncbi:MAG: peptidase [Microcoleaceae cyanobacterium]
MARDWGSTFEPWGRSRWRFVFFGVMALVFALGIQFSQVLAQEQQSLPRIHPLPPELAKWPDQTPDDGAPDRDYFDQIEPIALGYLVWSGFPIKIYVEPVIPSTSSQNWSAEVRSAILDWGSYLPLEIVDRPDSAKIQIFRRRPPLEPENLRASSAETRYQIFTEGEDGVQRLAHRFVIWLSPSQTGKYVAAAARHEFGHALGIWGHSPVKTDVMYFSQVGEPPPISPRDVNTLKRIYQQPTRLGWPVRGEID